ncbi:DNA-binding response regulator [Kineosporia sp. NBRC 101677]|uniref:response regulator n=1 Tax=Kineosporia sp. NBRC 101677 TaxID=3032197 RepID=UPI0024A49008|nr:response regulator transcription factor [Kineosporia sp. NBRC 101677]GLY13634.1 DNA-binding response regulator [Kineosporia sp. NBRC 101677]
MTIRVLLADDHEFFRSGFRAALETQPDLECVADVGDGRAAVQQVLGLVPDVAVLDVRMPVLDGLGAAEAVLGAGSPTRILLLTTYDDDAYLYRALQAGASGFLLKSMPTEELLGAIRIAARGDALIDPSVTQRLAARLAAGLAPPPEPADLQRLTVREKEILLELARGRSNAEIAAALFVGEQTVKTHVSRVLAKLGLRDRVQAVVYVYENGLLPR